MLAFTASYNKEEMCNIRVTLVLKFYNLEYGGGSKGVHTKVV